MLKYIGLALIALYQYILSPMKDALLGTPTRCRFYPSCSEYARQSLHKFGLFTGTFLTFKRLVRCHPYNPGGLDPVPDTIKNNYE